MSDSSNNGSYDGGSRSNEWEVVSLSLSSHSLSASTSLYTCTEQGIGGETFATTLNSEYVLCSPKASLEEPGSQSLSNSEDQPEIVGSDSDTGEKKTWVTSEVPAALGLSEGALLATKDIEQEDHGRRDTLLPLVRSCASQMQEFSGMDWLEHMIPVDYEQDEIRSMLYRLASDSKAGAEPEFGQAGPLLGSCLSSVSSPTIVNRANSMQLLLGEEVFQDQIDEVDKRKAPACVIEKEVPSLPGLGTEISGEDLRLEFQDSGAGVDTQEMKAEDTKSSAPLWGPGYDEQAYEAWWKQQAALWCMQSRQVNTLWSIVLAATVMGLVIMGHQWQHERSQNQQLCLQLCSKDEKISQLVFQIAHLKEDL